MADLSRLSLDIADLPLTPFGMRSPIQHPLQVKSNVQRGPTKLSRPQIKSPSTGAVVEKLPAHSPKVTGKENSSPHTIRASKKVEPSISQQKFPFFKPLRPVRKNSQLPALEEEEDSSDHAFVTPSPRATIPVSRCNIGLPTKNTASYKLNSGSPIGKTPESKCLSRKTNCEANPSHSSTVLDRSSGNFRNGVHVNLVGDKRRDSQFTDIDDGSFVEFTSEIPEGRIIPHTDSLVSLRNNLYFTCPDYANETEYSTSSKTPNARYNFHHLVDAVKRQQLQPQISEELRFSSSHSPSLPSKKKQENKAVENEFAKEKASSCQVLNSTMKDGKKQAQCPFLIPDISTLTLEDLPENSQKNLPHQANSHLLLTKAKTDARIESSALKNLGVGDSSVSSEDVLLISSDDDSSEEFECRPDKMLELGNQTDEHKKSGGTKKPREDKVLPTPPVQSTLHRPSGSKDFHNVQVHACVEEKINQPQTPQKNVLKYASKSTNPLSTTSPNFDNLKRSAQPLALHSNRNEKLSHGNANSALSNVTPSKVGSPGAILTAKAKSPRTLQGGIFSSRKGASNTPNTKNCKISAENNSSKLPASTISPSRAPTKTKVLPPNSPGVLFKTSVCNWVINSPFKDSSFGTSFAKKLATDCDAPKNTLPYHAPVLETSDESSDEVFPLKNDALLSKEKRPPNNGREISSLPSKRKSPSTGKTSIDRKERVPVAVPKCTENASEEFDKIIETASNLESLKLRLEATSRTHTTALTLGRVAKQSSHTSGKKLASDDGLPILQLPAVQSVKSNDFENKDTFPKQDSASENPFVTERKKKRNERRASISKKLFESPSLEKISWNETDTEFKSLSPRPTNGTQKLPSVPNNGKKLGDESSDSDELTDYLSKWKKPIPPVTTDRNGGNLSHFLTDDESSGEEINYRLIPLGSSIRRKVNRNKINSVSEFLNDNSNKKTKKYVSEKKIKNSKVEDVILSDSSDIFPSPKPCNVLPKPSTAIVHLSDSDDDDDDNDIKLLPPPFVCKTPQPVKTNKVVKVCPKTDIPVRNKNKHQNLCSRYGTPTLSFLASLSTTSDNLRIHPDAITYKKSFAKSKERLTDHLYKVFNGQVFDNKLPQVMKITWNVRMTKTAGFCYYQVDRSKPSGRGARIELSTKVVDNCERLRDTLVHELCHAAAWIISGYKDGHGPLWRTWARKALITFPELPDINRCHNYEISCKFTYQCTGCGYSIGRHSKSLDTERKACGRCHNRFELLPPNGRTGPSSTGARTPGPFALFVKENYNSVKKSSNLKHSDVMKVLGEKFRMMKT